MMIYILFYSGGHDMTTDPEQAQRLFETYSTADETPRVLAVAETADVTSEFK